MSSLPMPYVAALITVAVGIVLGTLASKMASSTGIEPGRGDSETDLEERLAHFIAQLRDLEEQRGRLQPAEYDSQKAEFEARAAAVLKAIKEPKEPKAKKVRDDGPATPTVAFLAARPQLRGALWGGGTVAVFAVLYSLVVAEEHPAPPPMAGQRGPMQGGGGGGGGAPSADSGELRALTQKLQQNPDDVPSLVRAAHLLLKSQMLPEAEALTREALKRQPDNAEALVHDAVITAGQGDGAAAFQKLDAVLQKDSTFAEAWFFRGMLAMQAGKQDLMRESMAQFVRYAPEGPQKERIRAMLSGMAGGGGGPGGK